MILMGDFLTETIFREERQDNIITRAEFEKRYENTVYKTETSLSEEMDIDPEYAALIVPTMVICKDFMDLFNAEALWMPGVSLLDGIAYDFGEKKNFIKSAHNFENDILVAARNIAKRYSTGKDHIKGTTDLALAIFDSMKKVHGMGDRERLLLQIAVQLHDCGKVYQHGRCGRVLLSDHYGYRDHWTFHRRTSDHSKCGALQHRRICLLQRDRRRGRNGSFRISSDRQADCNPSYCQMLWIAAIIRRSRI
ncbi:MAG: hypothetical protein ACLURP_02940 [Ruminococcus sp.]